MLGSTPLINLKSNPLTVTFDGRTYQVHTSLDFGLQNYLLKRMDRVNSRFIGIVAMAPDSGRLLALAGFNKVDPQTDPCLKADYPAASIFKIVAAAAAAALVCIDLTNTMASSAGRTSATADAMRLRASSRYCESG